MAIRIGIIGYGNLARGVESEIRRCPDMELKGVFTRRDPSSVTTNTPGVPVFSVNDLKDKTADFDVMIN